MSCLCVGSDVMRMQIRDGIASDSPRLQFFDDASLADAFGFVDPDCVVRGVHLIPGFAYGTTEELLGPSFVRQDLQLNDDTDWTFFYVNM